MGNRIAVSLAVLLALGPAAGGVALAQDQPPPQHRESAIVGGKRIQPRADEFSGNGSAPDVPKSDAKQLDSLYSEILRDSSAPLGSSDAPTANPAPPPPPPKPR